MTTFDFTTEHCPACGTPCEVGLLTSSTTFGPPDLDARPGAFAESVALAGPGQPGGWVTAAAIGVPDTHLTGGATAATCTPRPRTAT